MAGATTDPLQRLESALRAGRDLPRKRMLVIVNPYASTVSDRLKNLVVYALRGSYRIGFGPVDVYIQQVHPAARSSITIWTHSTGRGRVRLRIRSEGRMLGTAQTAGGRWSRLAYRLPAKVRSGQQVLVAARVGSGTGLNLAIVKVIVR